MGVMANRNNLIGKLSVLLVAVTVLAGCQPRSAEDQDIEQLRQSAKQGDASAQYNLGSMYANGEGVPQDTARPSSGSAWPPSRETHERKPILA